MLSRIRAGVVSVMVVALLGVVPTASAVDASGPAGSGSAGLFPDVPESHPFADEIGWLVGESITEGYGDGSFRPGGVITRQGMAAFLYRLAGSPEIEGEVPSFSDVPSGHPFVDEIGWLAQSGVTTGYPDGTFRPGGVITRGGMAAFLFRFTGSSVVAGAASFPDVPVSHPFVDEIGWLASSGVTTGFGDGTFRPGGPVSRQGMAAFLFRLAANPSAWTDPSLFGVAPPEPGDVDCDDFTVWGAANRWYGWFEPAFGDVADLVPSGADAPCPDLYEPMVAPDAVVVDEADADELDTTELDEGVLRFPASWPGGDELLPGAIVVGPPTEERPSGFLMEVTGRSESAGVVTVTVEQAAITDAIHQGTGTEQVGIDLSDPAYLAQGLTLEPVEVGEGAGTPAAGEGSAEFDWEKSESFQLSGPLTIGTAAINLSTTIEVGATVDLAVGCLDELLGVCIDPELLRLDASGSVRQTTTVGFSGPFASGNAERERKILTVGPQRMFFVVGGLPVWADLELSIWVNIDGEITTTVSGKIEQTQAETISARYHWLTGFTSDRQSEPLTSRMVDEPARPGAAIGFTTGVEARVDLDLYGVVGPEVAVEGYVGARWDSAQPYGAGVFAGLDLRAGVELASALAQLVGKTPRPGERAFLDLLPGVEVEANLFGWYLEDGEWQDQPLVFDAPAATPPGDWNGSAWESAPSPRLLAIASAENPYPKTVAGQVVEVELGDAAGQPHVGDGGLTGEVEHETNAAGHVDLSGVGIDPDTPPGTYTLIVRYENVDYDRWVDCFGGCALWRPLDEEFEAVSPPFEVIGLEILPEALLPVTAGQPYEVQLTVDGGVAPYTFAVVEGDLPDGMSLSSSGLLSGTVESIGDAPWAFTVRATDANGVTGEREYVLGGATEASAGRLSAGGYHTCVLDDGGVPSCWGVDRYEGPAGMLLTPPAPGPFASISAGGTGGGDDALSSISCGLATNGAVACWGRLAEYLEEPPSGTFTAVDAGGWNACGIRAGGALECWGSEFSFGTPSPTPTGAFSSVSVGYWHRCGVLVDGSATCWGADWAGQASAPAGEFLSVSAGQTHSCGIRTDRTVVCWGEAAATAAPAGEFLSVSAGGTHTCGVRTDATIACWGANDDGQSSPPAGSFVEVAAGGSHSCALRSDDTVVCWGSDLYGESSPP